MISHLFKSMTYVHVKSKEDYNRLMEAYEKKGWMWRAGEKPTEFDAVNISGSEDLYIQFNDSFIWQRSRQLNGSESILSVNDAIEKLNWTFSSSMTYPIAMQTYGSWEEIVNKYKETITAPIGIGTIGGWNIPSSPVSVTNMFIKPKPSFMSNVKTILKNLTLSATDKVLRAHDLEDEHGSMTMEARQLMNDELIEDRWAFRREQIAQQLELSDKEQK